MSSKPDSRLKQQGGLCLLALLLLCASTFADAYAQQNSVNLKLNISVVDQNGKPVPNAKITIPRQGKNANGDKLGDIRDAPVNEEGKLIRGNTDFDLTGEPHKLIVTYPNSQQVVEELSHERLRQAFNGNKELTLRIAPPNGTPPPPTPESVLSLPIIITDEEGNPVPNANVSISHNEKNPAGQGDKVIREDKGTTGPDGRKQIIAQFNLSAAPYKLEVKAPPDFNDKTIDLSAQQLKEASGDKDRTPGITITVNEALIPGIIKQLRNVLNYLFWGLGLLFLLLLIISALAAWLLHYRLEVYRLNPDGKPTDGSIEQRLFNLTTKVDSLAAQMLKKSDIVVLTKTVVDEVKASGGSQNTTPQEKAANADSEPILAAPATHTLAADEADRRGRVDDKPAPSSLPYEGAQNSYLNLINRIPTTPEPIYLEVEGARSIAGRLEDSTVYLSQMPHSQAAFVLFTENGDSGWVFPNPTISFRSAELRDVFPRLTENEFTAAKESIMPKPVKKVEEKRWMVVA